MKSHSQVPGLRTQTYLLGGYTIEPTTLTKIQNSKIKQVFLKVESELLSVLMLEAWSCIIEKKICIYSEATSKKERKLTFSPFYIRTFKYPKEFSTPQNSSQPS